VQAQNYNLGLYTEKIAPKALFWWNTAQNIIKKMKKTVKKQLKRHFDLLKS
tara:strand:+ start:103 stop:255 length:153 start_codon:yes stop_codon:yes gene_type:complete